MKLHRSIFTQLFPYQSGEENAPTAPAFPAPAGAMRATEQSVEEKPQDMFDRTKSPIRHPDQRLDPAMAMNETVVTPTAEESVTIDENAPAPEYPQPMNTPPIETTQLERLRPGDRDPVLVERMAQLRRAPMDNMELGGATTATYAPTAPVTSVPMPTATPGTASPDMMPGKKEKKTKKTFTDLYPNFEDPYPNPQNPQEEAANALARMQEQKRNPVNKDKGGKGLALELLENFLYGLGKTPAGASVGQALLLGGTGAGAGFINKGWNEQRAAEAAIPEPENDVQRTGQMVNQKFARDDKTRDNLRQDADLIRKRNKDIRDAEIRRDTLDWKKEDRDRYYDLEQIKQDAREAKDEKTYNLAVQRQEELKRHNLQTEGQAATNEVGRMARAGQTQAGATTRAQINSADKARGVIASIDKMVIAGTVDAADAEAKKAAFLQTLTPEVRKQLGMK